jgi:hypothetical protein
MDSSNSSNSDFQVRKQQQVSRLALGAALSEISHLFVTQPIKQRGPPPAKLVIWLRFKLPKLKGLEFISLSNRNSYLFCSIVVVQVWVFGIVFLTLMLFFGLLTLGSIFWHIPKTWFRRSTSHTPSATRSMVLSVCISSLNLLWNQS